MIFQGEDLITGLMPLLTVFILVILMFFMAYMYIRVRSFTVTTIIFLFSLIFGYMAFGFTEIPFSPYIQIFFMVFQLVFFILDSLQTFRGKKEEEEI